MHDPRTVVLYENVDIGGEPTCGLDGTQFLQIEHDALLAGVELTEVAAGTAAQRQPRAHHVALRGLDLDDVRTQVGEQSGTMRAGYGGREIENA